MTNEHVLMTQKTFPISMTCLDSGGIEKGQVLKMSDPNTAAASDGAEDYVAGICYTEKIADDGNTQLAVLSGPGDELKAIASGTVAIGDPLVTAIGPTSNYLSAISGSTANLSGSVILGYSKEAAVNDETFKYVLNITAIAQT